MGGAHCRAAFTVSLQMNEPLCFTVRGHVRLHCSAPVIFKVMDSAWLLCHLSLHKYLLFNPLKFNLYRRAARIVYSTL